MTTKKKVFVFFNCDDAESNKTASMNPLYNTDAYNDTQAGRKALLAKIRKEAKTKRIAVSDNKAVETTVLTGFPPDASAWISNGEIVSLDLH